MEIWQVPRLMNRLMYDHIRDKDQSIFPYTRFANYSLLHVDDESDQATDRSTIESEDTKLNEVSTTDHWSEDRSIHKLFSWSKQIRNSATKIISALRHQIRTRDDSREEIIP